MKKKFICRIVIDLLMTILLLVLMQDSLPGILLMNGLEQVCLFYGSSIIF